MAAAEVVITVDLPSAGDDAGMEVVVETASVTVTQQSRRKSSEEGEMPEESLPQTAVSPVGSDVDAEESVKANCCRICLEDVTEEDFRNEIAMKLNCRCSDGLDVVHVHCAKKWFSLKRSLSCEICGHEIDNLPEKFQRKLQKLIEQRRQVEFRSEDDDVESNSTQQEAAHLKTFTVIVYGLVPAFLSFLAMMLFFHGFLRTDIATTVVLSFALSTSTLMHFLMESRNGIWHLVFVLLYLMTIISMASLFYYIYNWEGIAAAIAATLAGPMTAVVLFAALKAILLCCFPMFHLWNSSVLV